MDIKGVNNEEQKYIKMLENNELPESCRHFVEQYKTLDEIEDPVKRRAKADFLDMMIKSKLEKEGNKKRYPNLRNKKILGNFGKYLEETKDGEVQRFVFKPIKTEQQVKDDFLKKLESVGSPQFIESAKSNIKVSCQYFPVNYAELISKTVTHYETTDHYVPDGNFSLDGKLEDDKLTVNVSQGKTYSHSTTSSWTTHEDAYGKAYSSMCQGICDRKQLSFNFLEEFDDVFYKTAGYSEKDIASIDDVKDCDYFKDEGAEWNGRLGDYKFKELQILWFPVWKVEVKHDRYIYENYVSDITDASKIIYLDENAEILNEKETIRERSFRFWNFVSWGAVLIMLSYILHLAFGKAVNTGVGYAGLFVKLMGKDIGSPLNKVLAGFTFIGTILLISSAIGMPSVPDMKAHPDDPHYTVPKKNYNRMLVGFAIIIIDIVAFTLSAILWK